MPLNFLNTGYFADKVGIGTNSPDASLHINPATSDEIAIAINGTQNYSAGEFHRIAAGDANSLNRLAIGFGYDDPVDWAIRYSSYGRHEFYTGNDWGDAANTEKMVITSAGNVGIGTASPDYLLDLYKFTDTTSTTTGTTLQRLWNYVGGDLQQQKTFIDFVFQDANDNEYPQVRIGAEVGQNGPADTQILEGSGAFVVYTNNATGDGPGTPTGLAERFRVDYKGDVGIGTNSPFSSLQVGNNTFSGGNGMAADSRVGISNHGILTGMMLASTYNDPLYPEYGLVFVQGASTASYNVWSISPDGPAKGSGLSFIYKADATNIHNQTPQVYFEGSTGHVGIGTISPNGKLSVQSTININDSTNFADKIAPLAIGDVDGVDNSRVLLLDSNQIESNGDDLYLNFNSTQNVNLVLGGGKVGIGTTDPQMGLHVADTKGALFGPSGSGTASSYFSPSDENTLNGSYGKDSDSADIWLNYRGYQDGFTRFRDTRIGNGKGGLVAIFDGSAGNVGIGITGPQSKLQVAGGIQMADDTDTAVVGKVGTMRYRTGTEYVEVTGIELITNGDFSTDTAWTKGTGWSIGSGVASCSGVQTGYSSMIQDIGTSANNKYYRVKFTISNYSAGLARPWIGANNVGSNVSADGDYVQIIQAASASTSGAFYVEGSPAWIASLDNVSVMEVTAETASYADMCMQTGASTYEWVNIVRNTY